MFSKPLLDLVHPDDRDLTVKQLEGLNDGGPPVSFENRCCDSDGSCVWLFWQACLTAGIIYLTAQDVTVLKRSEQLQRESEKYKLLFQSAPVGMLAKRDGKLLLYNDTMLRQVGYTRKDIDANDSVEQLYYDAKERRKILNELKKEGALIQREIRFKKKDGTPYLVSLSLREVEIEGQKSVLAMVEDISRRKLAEEKTKKYQALLETAAVLARLGSWEFDIATGEIFWSKECYEIHGLDPEKDQIDGEKAMALVHPKDIRQVEKFLSKTRSRKTDSIGSTEYRIITPNGLVRNMVANSRIIFDESKKPRKVIGTVQDVTGIKKVEADLIESEQRSRSMVNALAEGVALYDHRGMLMAHNNNAERILGLSSAEMKGRSIVDRKWKIIREDGTVFPSSEYPAIQTLKRGKPMHEIVMGVLLSNGETRWISINTEPIFVRGQKKPSAVVTSFADISRRKKVEAERENLIKELDHFVYSVSHDLSAPLKSMLGLVGIAKLETKDENQLSYLGMIEESVLRLEAFIKDVIDYSRNSRTEVRQEPVGVRALIKGVLENLKFTEGFEHVDFKIRCSTRLRVNTDPVRIKIILNNLISNAIKFVILCKRKDPSIEINVITRKSKVMIAVVDNGPGILKKDQKNIFKMFFRGSLTAPGSGLGLYIAKESANRINAELEVTSNKGKGSTFTLCLLR